jgi:UDP-N-acetylmuramoylalanine--D-glutamate ligase
MELDGRNAVVVGLARSGVAAAAFLADRGARVTASDVKPREALTPEARALEAQGVRLETGAHRVETLLAASLVVVSPGVPWDLPELVRARGEGIDVIAELELACRYLPGEVVAVTGTKGKSTTTAAVGAMLRAAGGDVRVCGNIGQPAIACVAGSDTQTVFVIEASSFQLEGVRSLHPRVAVFLNLSDDHLDRHLSFDVYATAKARIFLNQTAEDWAIINAGDPRLLALARAGRARLLGFGASAHGAEEAAFFHEGLARLRHLGQEETLFARTAVRLPGAHLAEDLLAAAAAARLMGASPAAIQRAIEGFEGAEHVLELVADVDGVRYFNDSKATNVEAACKSLEAFDRPVIAVMGGRFKGGDLARLAQAARGRVKLVLAIGEAQAQFVDALSPVVAVAPCASLAAAVARAQEAAQPGDVVLLAPACASFDMFEDYAQRGQAFKQEVLRFAERHPLDSGAR